MVTEAPEPHPGPPPPAVPTVADRRQKAIRWWIAGAVLAMLVGSVAASLLVDLPYYALRPGSARPTTDVIEIAGVETFESEGEVDFPTVAVRRLTAFEAARAWLDDDVRILTEEELFGRRTAEENRQFNIQLMDTSKQDAARVALLKLGYEVPVELTGETIVGVSDGSPAAGTLEVGDTIVAVGGEPLEEVGDLFRLLEPTRPGDEVILTVDRVDGRATEDVTLTLGVRPDERPQGFIGVDLQARDLVYRFPFDIEIDSGSVGGPSGGLAFTLGVLDLLTPGELTGGVEVAATGTISGTGTVGPVGGIAQKAAVVRKAGIELFLVPPGEGAEARERAGEGVRVVEVGTLDEALVALDELGGNALELGTPGAGEEALAGN